MLVPLCRGNHARKSHAGTPDAFSDGVFAVLITVRVLELRPPEILMSPPAGGKRAA
jgi:uncharacterized membrane protein